MSAGAGGERTEKATPKKRREERERGNVFLSHDLTTAVSLLGMFGVLRIAGPATGRKLQAVFTRLLQGTSAGAETFTINAARGYYVEALRLGITAVLPFFLCAVATAVLVSVVQTRFLMTGKNLTVKFDRINPLNGFKRLFSSRSVMETVKSLAKITLIIAAIYSEFMNGMQRMPALCSISLPVAIQTVFDRIVALAFRCGIILAGLSVIDYVYQWWRHEKDMRMSKEEIRQEYKLTEGNPQTKGRIKQIQQAMSQRRMMAAVPQADVVVTNPTHYAIALRYDARKEAAPVILAKGKGHIALRIKEIARENRITLVENRPLARSLYASCEIGEMIPASFYQAVAEVLAYVARLKKGALK